MYHDQDINLTWEGDNNMLMQQTTKYILKISRKLTKGKNFEDNSLYFLNEYSELPEKITLENLRDTEFYELILKKSIQDETQAIVNAMMAYKGEGADDMDVWNKAQPYYGRKLASTFGRFCKII